MHTRTYTRLRQGVTFFIGVVVSLAVVQDNYLLAIIGVIVGMIFLAVARSRAKIRTDEREALIQEKAARLTYAIFAPTIGIGALILLFPSHSKLAVFAKGEFAFLESLGMVLAYLTLFLITLYALSYHFLNAKYGGRNDE